MIDMCVDDSCCERCRHSKELTEVEYINFCSPCLKAQATEGLAPYKSEEKNDSRTIQ
jgi:hypothetical protein